MNKERKRYKSEFKAKVAIAAVKEIKTINQLADEFSLHPNQISLWKKELTSRAGELFSVGKEKEKVQSEELTNRLYQEIGQLKVELDWLKKKVKH